MWEAKIPMAQGGNRILYFLVPIPMSRYDSSSGIAHLAARPSPADW